jgi:hypothetical protein
VLGGEGDPAAAVEAQPAAQEALGLLLGVVADDVGRVAW